MFICLSALENTNEENEKLEREANSEDGLRGAELAS